jgi:hypothetical protein
MFPKPKPSLTPNTYAYESEPLVKPTGFREYDARWLLGKEINLMGVQALGMGLGTLIRELGVRPEIVTGHDFRGYSASAKTSLISGLLAAGCKVHDIGLAVTPMAYFAQFELDVPCVATRLQQAITQSMPDLKQRFEAVGGELIEVAPDRLSGIIKVDYDRWIAIIREAGIRLE